MPLIYIPKDGENPVPYVEIVGRVLTALREARMSQKSMAEALETTQSYISRIERGRIPITIDMLARWANILGMTVAEMVANVDRLCAEITAQGGVIQYDSRRGLR